MPRTRYLSSNKCNPNSQEKIYKNPDFGYYYDDICNLPLKEREEILKKNPLMCDYFPKNKEVRELIKLNHQEHIYYFNPYFGFCIDIYSNFKTSDICNCEYNEFKKYVNKNINNRAYLQCADCHKIEVVYR